MFVVAVAPASLTVTVAPGTTEADAPVMTVPDKIPVGDEVTVSGADFVTPFATALMLAVALETVVLVVTVNVVDACPCGMTMLAGVVASALSLEVFTRTPPVPATPVSVTVAVELEPP
jgi:hypothetical protein